MKVVGRVPSLTHAGTRYEISRGPRGDLVCACPAFEAHRVDETTDKHIAIHKAATNALERCFAAGHEDGTKICAQCLTDVFAAAAAKFKKTETEKFRAVHSLKRVQAKVHDIRQARKKR